LLGA
jgi:hypothetical protein